jgi:hypothetical protein
MDFQMISDLRSDADARTYVIKRAIYFSQNSCGKSDPGSKQWFVACRRSLISGSGDLEAVLDVGIEDRWSSASTRCLFYESPIRPKIFSVKFLSFTYKI